MNTKITLYYKEGCYYCDIFRPTWEKLKSLLKCKNIKYEEYEKHKNNSKIIKNNIKIFPTIKIKKGNNVYDYNGVRSVDAIMNDLTDNNYESKYNKYKKKYLTKKYLLGGGDKH